MPKTVSLPAPIEDIDFEKEEREYQANLTLEHYMESPPHAKQREITLESLALVRAVRKDFHLFNELLVQYLRIPTKGLAKPLGQVVPDNMIVIYDGELSPGNSYNTPLQPAAPFMVLEYVSKSSKRKDYKDNKRMYEKELQVPYYLLFDPLKQVLHLWENVGGSFVDVKPNREGRLAVPALDLEVAILDDWTRFWYKGELLLLPAELQSGWKKESEARRAVERDLMIESKAREQITLARNKAEERVRRLEARLKDLGESVD